MPERLQNGSNLPSEQEILEKKDDTCPVQWALSVLRQAHEDACGHGVFCREGVKELLLLTEDITQNRGSVEDIEMIRALCGQVMLGADCQAAYEGARLTLLSLDTFGEDWEAHVLRRRCKTGQCAAFPKPSAPTAGQPMMHRRRRGM